ncbi:MAG: spindle pole body protein [Piptocephalis tieghemiana]|nr:MAG: spindle pole body protein [Piptocephalis tieghemiana]
MPPKRRASSPAQREQEKDGEEGKMQRLDETPTPSVTEVVHDSVREEEEEEEEEEVINPDAVQPTTLYLDTVDRTRLDFDFEKLCSVSLSNVNVYACLVCGKYFQGRGKSSHAYFHSLDASHYIFINLETLKVYCLPDGHEIQDPSLDDIKYVLAPSFTPDLVRRLSSPDLPPSYDLQRKPYYPGYIGLNNIKKNDDINVILQCLAHVNPLRDWLLLADLDKLPRLEKRLAELLRKMWNAKAFKGQVSPHELIQEVSSVSQRRFVLGQLADPAEVLVWLLNRLHRDLGGSRRPRSSKVAQIFQGEMLVESQEIPPVQLLSRSDQDQNEMEGIVDASRHMDPTREIKQTKSHFFLLTLDLPPTPLFQDEQEKNIIPQVALSALMAKYDGTSPVETHGTLRRYKILHPPPYLIVHIRRFKKTGWSKEKNPTIVTFPLSQVPLFPYGEKGEKIAQYDLIATISHEGSNEDAEEGAYRVHVRRGEEQWLLLQDLYVEECVPQMIFLSESYLQVWKRREDAVQDDA